MCVFEVFGSEFCFFYFVIGFVIIVVFCVRCFGCYGRIFLKCFFLGKVGVIGGFRCVVECVSRCVCRSVCWGGKIYGGKFDGGRWVEFYFCVFFFF